MEVPGLNPPKVDSRLGGYEGSNSSIEKFVDSRLFITFARTMMIVSSLVILPIVTWMVGRAITTADKLMLKVDKSSMDLRLMQHELLTGFRSTTNELLEIKSDIKDHEGRLRVLERMPVLPIQPGQPVQKR